MKKPSFEDFGLVESTLTWSKQLRRKLVIGAILSSLLAVVIGLTTEAWGFLFLVPPLGTVFLYHVARWLACAASPRFRTALQFEEAEARYEEWWLRAQAEFWQGLRGRPFEVELAALFARSGYDVELTPTTDDQGVDLWISRSTERRAVQCKAHSRRIGPGAVREFYGAMQHLGCADGILASVSGFTSGAAAYASGKKIELLDLDGILAMQKRLR